MATTNPVYNVLVSSGNQAILAAGSRVDALANGQIGFFNYHTGLSVNGSVPATAQDIFIAVGINRTSGGTAAMEDFSKSAGQMIQAKNIRAITVKGTTDTVTKIVDVTLPSAKCLTTYGIKLLFASTQLGMQNGYNQNVKSFSFYEECCTSDTDSSILPSDVLIDLKNQINADPDKAVTAYIVDNTTTPGTAVILADQAAVDAFLALDAANRVQLRIVGNVETRPPLGDVNIKYYKSNRDFQVVLTDGFSCTAAAQSTFRAYQQGEGSGYDLKQLENFAAGWGVPGPYRTNAITGLPNSVESFLSATAKYNVISLAYDEESVGGWLEYKNNLETILAIPCADTVTLTGFFAVADLIFTKLGAFTNDVAAMDCTNTNITTINDATLDGIESLG